MEGIESTDMKMPEKGTKLPTLPQRRRPSQLPVTGMSRTDQYGCHNGIKTTFVKQNMGINYQ
jgi:hypothetical protein